MLRRIDYAVSSMVLARPDSVAYPGRVRSADRTFDGLAAVVEEAAGRRPQVEDRRPVHLGIAILAAREAVAGLG